MRILTSLALFLSAVAVVQSASNSSAIEDISSREKKALSVFQVVRFPNNVCIGNSNFNGTCYTSSECVTKGGTNAGSCASGFGVCCVFVLACGGSSSDNTTYIVQASSTTLASSCNYKICPCSANICRIRFDFTSFVIADPVSTALATTVLGSGIGDCVTDSFSISSPGNRGSPTICGFNTGQHMIVDANTLCHNANFALGSSTATARSWNIKVTQYACGVESLGGPPDCLQYFTGSTGTVSSFNFLTTSTTVLTTATHLSNQRYQICIRRESGMCSICYVPAIIATAPASFGLSASGDATGIASQSATDTLCLTDYLAIPGGMVSTATATLAGSLIIPTANRVCGRFFNPAPAAAINAPVCTRQVPFRLSFFTDGDEQNAIAAINTFANELAVAPTGSIGFSLRYTQSICP